MVCTAADFFRAIATTLRQGRTWRGVIVNRNRSGELYEEDSSITPVRGEDGETSCFVCVLRNLGRERKLEADLDRLRSDRDSVVRVMADVRVGATIESTAASFCQAVIRLEEIAVARVLLIDPGGEVVPLGATSPLFLGWEVGVPLTFDRLGDLLDKTRSGSWWLPLAGPVGDGLVDCRKSSPPCPRPGSCRSGSPRSGGRVVWSAPWSWAARPRRTVAGPRPGPRSWTS